MASYSGDTYKYKFLSEPDDAHKCPICLDVAEEPWQHGKCGRLFCKMCMDSYGTDKPCSHCRMEQPQYFEDNKSKREIMNLRVTCDNIERNCEWKGTVGELKEHLDKCKFTLLPCPNECIDNQMNINYFARKSLRTHKKNECPNREYKCINGWLDDKCGEKGTHYYITQVHDKVCLKKIIPCINIECPKRLQRQQMDQHVKSECEHTVIACKHKSIGCETKMKRRDLEVHELDDSLHLHMAINTVTQLKEDTTQLRKQLDSIMKMKIVVVDYEQRKQNNTQFTSPEFYTSHGYHMSLLVDANGYGPGEGTHISVFALIVEGKHDAHLHWPFLGSITFTLLNQLEDRNHYIMPITITTEINLVVGKSWGYPEFIPHSELGHDTIKNTQYLKDNTLYFTAEVELEESKLWLHNNTLR